MELFACGFAPNTCRDAHLISDGRFAAYDRAGFRPGCDAAQLVRPLLHFDAPRRRLGGRKNVLRCAVVRKSERRSFAFDTSSWVLKIFHSRAVLS
jgi:hypothetical protein